MRITRTARRLSPALLAAAATTAGFGYLAAPAFASTPSPSGLAASAGPDAPSSCRPANHRAVVKPDAPSAGHRHYRVVLSAPEGYSACTLAGTPIGVTFHGAGGGPLAVRSAPAAGQSQPVSFGPGHPVHFDIQVPNTPGGAHASSVTFTLPAPGGTIPGDQEASGPMEVDSGTQIGPIQPGQ